MAAGPALGADGNRLLKSVGPGDIEMSYGAVLAVGDINRDGLADLAVGSPKTDALERGGRKYYDAGSAQWYSGHATKLLDFTLETQTIFRSDGIGGTLQHGDHFGSALVIGDFNGDGRDDVAVSAPYSDDARGDVYVIFSDRSGQLVAAGAVRITPTVTGKDTGHVFGWSLAAGDFDNDGDDELAIGARAFDEARSAGKVEIHDVNGTITQLTGPQACDLHFGYSLGVSDFTGDGVDDLIVGAPGDTVSGVAQAGAAYLFAGDAGVGLDTIATSAVHQAIPGPLYTETPQPSPAFWPLHKAFSGGDMTPPGERLGSSIAS